MKRQPPPGQQMEDYEGTGVPEPPSKRSQSNDHDTENPTESRSLKEPVANFLSCRYYPSSAFEGLPPEIRLRIVESGLGMEDLRAAVRASPALHRQYRLADRRLMLRAALHTSLGPALVDMWAAHKVARMDWGNAEGTEKERMATFMTEYIELRDSWPRVMPLEDQLRVDDLVEMRKYYLVVVKSLLDYFSIVFLSYLRERRSRSVPLLSKSGIASGPGSFPIAEHGRSLDPDSWHPLYEEDGHIDGTAPQDKLIIDSGYEVYLQRPLSRSETVRLTRALYRSQLWWNIYGFGTCGPGMVPCRPPAPMIPWNIACMFHKTFNAWEIEEMVCIYHHMLAKIERLFRDMRERLFRYDEQHKGEIRIFSSDNARRIYNSRDYYFIRTAVSRGLKYFLDFLSLPHNEQDARFRVVIDNLGEWISRDHLSLYEGAARGNDLRKSELEALVFRGESGATTSGPPFCWWLIWKGAHIDRYYGGAIPQDLREWGYIFWDRERVVDSRASELLLHTWRSHHEIDPRATSI